MKPLVCLLTSACVLSIIPSALAATNWILSPSVSGDWSIPQNWNNGVPTSNTDASINNGGTATVTSNVTCRHLWVGTAAGSGTVKINGGSLAIQGNAYLGDSGSGNIIQSDGTLTVPLGFGLNLGKLAGSSGTYTLTGGSVSGNCELLGDHGTAQFVQSGGTNAATYWVVMAAWETSSASYKLQGGSLSARTGEFIGARGTAHFTQSGGTNTINSSHLLLGSNTGGIGIYDLIAGQLSARDEVIGDYFSSTGIFTQSGGTNTVRDRFLLGRSLNSSGTYNLNGGTLITSQITAGSGTAVFNFGGGTLKASSPFSTTVPMTLTGNGGNANVDTTSGDLTLAGVLLGSGGLNKLGSGTLTLSAANTYSGDTEIEGGTLSIRTPYLDDQAGIHISASAKFDLAFTGSDAVGALYLDGVPAALGTWGSSLTTATFIDDIHFSGTGMLNVVPEPSTFALLLTATLGGLLWWRRRA